MSAVTWAFTREYPILEKNDENNSAFITKIILIDGISPKKVKAAKIQSPSIQIVTLIWVWLEIGNNILLAIDVGIPLGMILGFILTKTILPDLTIEIICKTKGCKSFVEPGIQSAPVLTKPIEQLVHLF